MLPESEALPAPIHKPALPGEGGSGSLVRAPGLWRGTERSCLRRQPGMLPMKIRRVLIPPGHRE